MIRRVLGWWAVGVLLLAQAAQGGTTVVVEDLADRWLVYDEAYGAYVPYIPARHGHVSVMSLELSLDAAGPYYLSFAVRPGVCLFAGEQLVICYERTDTVRWPTARLIETLGSGKQLLTFYHADKVTTAVGAPHWAYDRLTADVPPAPEASLLSGQDYRRRPGGEQRSLLMVGFVLVLGGYVIARGTAPRDFHSYFDFSRLFKAGVDDYDPNRRRTWAGITPLLLLVNSLALGFVLVLLRLRTDLAPDELPFVEEGGTLLGQFWRLSVIILVYFLGMRVSITVLGWLFGVQEAAEVHYYEFVRLMTLMSLLMLVLVFTGYQTPWLLDRQLLMVVVGVAVAFAALRVVKMAVVLGKSVPYTQLYVFAYLCATELIPFLLVIKYLRNNAY
ncbi:MAG: DUF4271 domain-containing protein [Catalinimonas sp.]